MRHCPRRNNWSSFYLGQLYSYGSSILPNHPRLNTSASWIIMKFGNIIIIKKDISNRGIKLSLFTNIFEVTNGSKDTQLDMWSYWRHVTKQNFDQISGHLIMPQDFGHVPVPRTCPGISWKYHQHVASCQKATMSKIPKMMWYCWYLFLKITWIAKSLANNLFSVILRQKETNTAHLKRSCTGVCYFLAVLSCQEIFNFVAMSWILLHSIFPTRSQGYVQDISN